MEHPLRATTRVPTPPPLFPRPYNDHAPAPARGHCRGGGGWDEWRGPWWSPLPGQHSLARHKKCQGGGACSALGTGRAGFGAIRAWFHHHPRAEQAPPPYPYRTRPLPKNLNSSDPCARPRQVDLEDSSRRQRQSRRFAPFHECAGSCSPCRPSSGQSRREGRRYVDHVRHSSSPSPQGRG